MKILIISAEVWRDGTNGGNVLSNLFESTDYEFAQIYCNPGIPSNKLCKMYYQITDSMLAKNILRNEKVGRVLKYTDYPFFSTSTEKETPEKEKVAFYNFFRKWRFEIFYIVRSLLWVFGDWKNEELKKFIREFNPDLIFAPCYASHAMLAIDRFTKKLSKAPVVSYISDDAYGLKQFRLSPLYWLNRFVLRKNIRKTMKLYDLLYTMTDEQKIQCEQDFGVNVKILRKSGTFDTTHEKSCVNAPIRFVFAGGIYLNRWKTLAALADVMREINREEVRMTLDIYTGYVLDEKINNRLNDGTTAKLHPSVSMEELRQIYRASDVALHAEGFDLKNRYAVRLSFSTKIVDCLDSGCAVMAICDPLQAGFAYLHRHDAAICVDALSKIKTTMKQILASPEMLIEYQRKAFLLGRLNHDAEKTRKGLIEDFSRLVNQSSQTHIR